MENPKTTCKDCESLIKKYGEYELNICPVCEHYFHGNACNCGRYDIRGNKYLN